MIVDTPGGVFLRRKIQLAAQLAVVRSIIVGDVDSRGRVPTKTLIRHDFFLVGIFDFLRGSTEKYNFGCIL